MNYSRPAGGLDMRAHPVEFGRVHVTVFEDCLGKYARAFGTAQHRHELRLHIGRKARIGRSRNCNRPQGFTRCDIKPFRTRLDMNASNTASSLSQSTLTTVRFCVVIE